MRSANALYAHHYPAIGREVDMTDRECRAWIRGYWLGVMNQSCHKDQRPDHFTMKLAEYQLQPQGEDMTETEEPKLYSARDVVRLTYEAAKSFTYPSLASGFPEHMQTVMQRTNPDAWAVEREAARKRENRRLKAAEKRKRSRQAFLGLARRVGDGCMVFAASVVAGLAFYAVTGVELLSLDKDRVGALLVVLGVCAGMTVWRISDRMGDGE